MLLFSTFPIALAYKKGKWKKSYLSSFFLKNSKLSAHADHMKKKQKRTKEARNTPFVDDDGLG